MIQKPGDYKNDTLNSFSRFVSAIPDAREKLSFECMTTGEIAQFTEKQQKTIAQELTVFFPIIFKKKEDWEYMVRHFFYKPEGNTIRQAIFVRDNEGKLVALCAFDSGRFFVDKKEIKLIYIHIRAVLPDFRDDGIGRLLSEKILKVLKPDLLLTTCVQLSSLYSWIRITDPEITEKYMFFPTFDKESGKTILLPHTDIDFIIRCFRMIYKSHVKENQNKLKSVINHITINMVRKGVNTFFDHIKWRDQDKRSQIAEDLGITEEDALLLVIKKRA